MLLMLPDYEISAKVNLYLRSFNKVYDCLSIKFFRRNPFLDAPSHLYKRLSSSVRVSVCPSVGILRNAVYRLLGALLKRL